MKNINTNSIIRADEETISSLKNQLEEIRIDCTTDDDYLKLNAQITAVNSALFAVAVKAVAESENIFSYLLQSYGVEQFKAVARTEKGNKKRL